MIALLKRGQDVRVKHSIQRQQLHSKMIELVEELSGQDIKNCYQCGKCSAGCPIAADMDMQPNQITRLCQLGLVDEALQSRTIWLCASCETCTTRCPREVDLAAVMDALRNLAIEHGIRSPERSVTFFNRTFLRIIRRYGRLFEMELIGRYNTGTLNFFKDITKAPKLLLRGRLGFLPNLTGRKTSKSVFEDVEKAKASRARKPDSTRK